jgi:hypothetical protein
MNHEESVTGSNAAILESYLRLAGICDTVYDIVTPNKIRDGILQQQSYDFLWAPHWEGNAAEKKITENIGEFLRQGKGSAANRSSRWT